MDVPLYEDKGVMFDNAQKWPWTEAAGYSIQQRFFLMRLERLTLLSRVLQSSSDGSKQQVTTSEEWQRKLVDRALYSTFRDCVSLGILDEARVILSNSQEKRDQIATKK